MFLFQYHVVHLWRMALILFLSALPSDLGRSDPETIILRTSLDSPLTPLLPTQDTETPHTPPNSGMIPHDQTSPAFFLQTLLVRYQENPVGFAKLPPRERVALHSFYYTHQYGLLWASPQGWSEEAQQLIAALREASKEGLRSSNYSVPSLAPGASLEEMAKADMALSATLVRYAHDARGARFSAMGISSHLASPALDLPSVEEVLSALHGSTDGAQILKDYNPTENPFYRDMKKALAVVRSTPKKGEEPSCSPSSKGAKGKKQCPPQKSNSTVLNQRAEGKILANMERLRWLPPNLGPFYVMVNIPTFNATVMRGDQPVLTSRVVVGTLGTRTPLVSSRISSLVVNPTWHVPPSIAKELIPKLQGKRHLRGYKVRWSENRLLITQPPGERNALGRLKFIFSSPYGIYMHDTPVRHLFSAPTRTFSHGCIRLDDPIHFGASILAYGSSSSEEKSYARLNQLIATKRESSIPLPQHVPIYVTYITVKTDGSDVVLLGDIYGYDAIMIPRLLP